VWKTKKYSTDEIQFSTLFPQVFPQKTPSFPQGKMGFTFCHIKIYFSLKLAQDVDPRFAMAGFSDYDSDRSKTFVKHLEDNPSVSMEFDRLSC
jgi:hypothetical protein